jgi:hypothetical protein
MEGNDGVVNGMPPHTISTVVQAKGFLVIDFCVLGAYCTALARTILGRTHVEPGDGKDLTATSEADRRQAYRCQPHWAKT